MPTQLGEGMTGSRTQSGPAPTYLRITLGEGTPTPTQSHQADRPASADSMHRAGPASRPFVLATLRALRLDPGPYPVLSTRRPKTSKTTAQQPLDTPRPFRDDSARRRASTSWGICLYPLMRRKDRSALSMPAAVQRSTIWPSRQRVTFRLVVRAMEIIDSMGLLVVRVLARRPSMPSRATVNISSSPSRSDAAALG